MQALFLFRISVPSVSKGPAGHARTHSASPAAILKEGIPVDLPHHVQVEGISALQVRSGFCDDQLARTVQEAGDVGIIGVIIQY